MAYRTNRGYRSGVSYSFSSRPSDYMLNSSGQMEYANNFDASYPGGGYGKTINGFNYVSGGSNRIDYNKRGGNSPLGTVGGGGGRGSGRGTGGGKGIGRSNGQREGIRDKGQRGIDTQNQFVTEGENNNSLTEIDLAIKNLNLSDIPQNQIITHGISQLEIVHYKKITFIKKQSEEEHLELIIRKAESLKKKFKKNSIG